MNAQYITYGDSDLFYCAAHYKIILKLFKYGRKKGL